MIEFATSDNGPTDLPVKIMPDGMPLADGDLEAMHASRQRNVINQVKKGILADELGFQYYFLTEHHFQPEGAEFSSNPLMVGMAMATKTKRVRIGQLANILSWHHPIRLAEQAAMLDVVSGGRLEFGIGRGGQPREMEIFGQVYGTSGADEQRNRLYVNECMEIIKKAWTEPSFSYQGQFYTIPPKWTLHHHPMTIEYFSQPNVGRTLDQVLEIGEPTGVPQGVRSHATVLKELSVFPRPVQQPHPQIWQPVVRSRGSMLSAAQRGYNISYVVEDFERIRMEVDTYYDEAEQQGFPDFRDRGAFKRGWDCEKKRGIAHFLCIHVVDHGVGDKAKYERGALHLASYLGGHGPAGKDGARGGHSRVFVAGTCDEIIEAIMKVKEAGRYDDFLCALQFHVAGLDWHDTEEQMRAFASDIMPVLQKECGGSPEPVEPNLTW